MGLSARLPTVGGRLKSAPRRLLASHIGRGPLMHLKPVCELAAWLPNSMGLWGAGARPSETEIETGEIRVCGRAATSIVSPRESAREIDLAGLSQGFRRSSRAR